jgi:hypothetical protein
MYTSVQQANLMDASMPQANLMDASMPQANLMDASMPEANCLRRTDCKKHDYLWNEARCTCPEEHPSIPQAGPDCNEHDFLLLDEEEQTSRNMIISGTDVFS